MRMVTGLCLALTGFGSAAPAATISLSATPSQAIANPTSAAHTGTFADNVTSSVSGVRRSPWEGTALDKIGVFSAITGSVSYDFASPRDTFKIVWGSPDSYNSLNFYLGTRLIQTVTGSDITSQFGLNLNNSLFTITDFGTFDSVVFLSSSPAFEYANVQAGLSTVPLPAGAVLLLSGIGGLTLLRRRKSA